MLLPGTLQCEKKGMEQQGVGAGGSANRPGSLQDPTGCLLLVIKYQEEKNRKKCTPCPDHPQPCLGKEIAKVQMGGVSPQPHRAWLALAGTVQLEMPTSRQSKGKRSWEGEKMMTTFSIYANASAQDTQGETKQRDLKGAGSETCLVFAHEDLHMVRCDAAQRSPPDISPKEPNPPG